MMVGCDSERWMNSEFLANCTVISGAYLYASEPVYAVPPHECVWGPWEDDDVTDTHTRHCTVEDCNKSQSEAHHWNAGVQTEAPTCTEPGTILYTCPDCHATKTGDIPALEHDWGEWSYYSVDSHIRSCKRENCDAEDHGAHEWGKWTSVDERTHKMVCSVCHGEQSGEHDWNDGIITKEPTEWEEGVKTYTCNTCTHTKTESLDKLVHECVWTDWYPDGDENHKRDCMDDHCDEFETLPHSWDDGVVTKNPTCKETGVKTYTCQTCMHTRNEECPITDHAWGDWAPDEDGLTHSRECDECEKSETADHRFGVGEVTQAPTHEAVGQIKYICEDCFYEYIEDIPVLTEHSWGDWVVNKQDMENTHIRFCICNESQTAPHSFGEGSITILPTDNSIHIEYVCEDCGYKKDVAANGTVVSFTNCEGLNMNPIVFTQLNGEETFTITLPTAADVAERDGFKLIGWTASIDGVTYALGAETVIPFEGNSSIVFTAEWAQVLGEGEHKLAAGEAYTTEMDLFALRGEEDTIYSGNQVFYVPKDGLYALIPAQNDEEVQ
jgi:hypothetical protein